MIIKHFKCKIYSVIVLSLGIAVSVFAQSSNSAMLLLQPLGARGVALGESYVAVADGVRSVYWNPAGLASSHRGMQVTFTHRPELIKGVLNYEYASIAYKFSTNSTVATNFSYMAFKPASFPPEDRSAYAMGVSYASKVTENLSAGITIKRVASRIDSFSAYAFAGDFGVLYSIKDVLHTRVSRGQFTLGASLSNLGQKVEFFPGQGDPLPQFLRLGFAYELKTHKTWTVTDLPKFAMLASFEYQNLLNEQEDEDIWEWGAGIELRFMGIVALRFGYHERHPKTDQTYTGGTLDTGTSFGAGLNLPIERIFKRTWSLTLQFDFTSAPQRGWVENYKMYTFGVNLDI